MNQEELIKLYEDKIRDCEYAISLLKNEIEELETEIQRCNHKIRSLFEKKKGTFIPTPIGKETWEYICNENKRRAKKHDKGGG